MQSDLLDMLTTRFEHGKSELELNVHLDVINFGKETIQRYTSSPIGKKTSTWLKFVQTHRDNYVELAGAIIELRGWLISHAEPSEIRSMVQKRLVDLIMFYSQLLHTLIIIGEGMATIVDVIQDDAMAMHNAKIIAEDILGSVGEVGLFISSN